MISGKFPKKYKSFEDKTLYCDICSKVMIDIQQKLKENPPNFAEPMGYRLDSKVYIHIYCSFYRFEKNMDLH